MSLTALPRRLAALVRAPRPPRTGRFRPARRRPLRTSVVLAALLAPFGLAACGSGGSGDTITIVVGYQSKTIDTVTAGTLLRSLGYFERDLNTLSASTHKKYRVTWQDYDTGAPITAQMIAGKIDIGSMGDYPLLINGSNSQAARNAGTQMVAVDGYNLRGALNMVVVNPDSKATTLTDLKGQKVSTSVGSAADGLLVQALAKAGLDPTSAVQVENQQPQVGASALRGGSVAGLSQFIAWPGLLVYQDQARLLYDGAQLGVPTLHGTVARTAFGSAHPDLLRTFLQAQVEATQYLQQHPLAAAESVAQATGLPAEVVYLYNGPNGMVTFDPTFKPQLTAAMRQDIPFLKSIGVVKQINLDSFINDTYIRQVIGTGYDAASASTTNPAAITGQDTTCNLPVNDPATAGELWLAGEETTHPTATPTCLLRAVRAAQTSGRTIRAAYVPDALLGTRWYADKSVWVLDPAAAPTARLLPFSTTDNARAYLAAHPGTRQLGSYAEAVAAA